MLSFIRKYILYVILVAVAIFALVYRNNNMPCVKPVTYKVGSIDSGFGISKAVFLDRISSAVDIWNDALNKELFIYDPAGEVTINLEYDDRQRAAQLRDVIDKSSDDAQSIKDQFGALKAQYESAGRVYDTAVSSFNAENEAYNTEVSRWNSLGGAPKAEFKKLTDAKQSLVIQRQQLDVKRLLLNSLSDQIKVYIDKYNVIVNDINTNVKVVNKTAGEFEQGIYSPKDDSITIYEFESKTKFVRVIAHELGHALGLDHNDNPESIMYKVNLGQSEKPTSDDIAALKTLCRIK